MGFSISPEKIIQMLFDVRREKKEKIANYLDAIATDAKLLADIWQEIWEKSQDKARRLDSEETLGGELLRQKIKRFQDSDWQITPNGKVISRLGLFYRDLSNVIGGKVDPNFHNLFNYHLASLLVNREVTKEAFDKLDPFINGRIFLDEDNSRAQIRRFSQLIDVLNREASAIEVLARTYRASM